MNADAGRSALAMPSGGPWRLRLAARLRAGGRRSGCLPIQGLPEDIGEIPAGEAALILYATAEDRAALMRWLPAAQGGQRRVTWLCTSETDPALSTGPMRMLAWTTDAAAELRRLGGAYLLRELLASGMGKNDLLVIDLLDPWLEQLPEGAALERPIADAAHLLPALSRGHRGPVLALMPSHARGHAVLPMVAGTGPARLASLDLLAAKPKMDVLRWGSTRDRRAALPAICIDLAPAPAGAWIAGAATTIDAKRALMAADVHTVHAMRCAVDDDAQPPPEWVVHEDIEALLAAAGGAVGATVVLAHDRPEGIARLAEAVHFLRGEHPRLLKIIVREAGAAMRRNDELALLRLGADAIMERGLGFAFLLQQIEALQGTAALHGRGSARNCGVLDSASGDGSPITREASLEAALQALAPEPFQGYLPTATFCDLVGRMIDRTARLRPSQPDGGAPLEHSLVHLPLLPHIAHVDALLACNPRRNGDLVTADAAGLSLFLFGCSPDDALAALDAIFTLPCSELARHVRIDPDATSQRMALGQLRRANEQTPVDYSAILRGLGSGKLADPGAAPVQPYALAVRESAAARGVRAHVLALRAATV